MSLRRGLLSPRTRYQRVPPYGRRSLLRRRAGRVCPKGLGFLRGPGFGEDDRAEAAVWKLGFPCVRRKGETIAMRQDLPVRLVTFQFVSRPPRRGAIPARWRGME